MRVQALRQIHRAGDSAWTFVRRWRTPEPVDGLMDGDAAATDGYRSGRASSKPSVTRRIFFLLLGWEAVLYWRNEAQAGFGVGTVGADGR